MKSCKTIQKGDILFILQQNHSQPVEGDAIHWDIIDDQEDTLNNSIIRQNRPQRLLKSIKAITATGIVQNPLGW
jgi:hypothetical protein